MKFTLQDLGWSPHFARQFDPDSGLQPARITEVHRDRLSALDPDGPRDLITLHKVSAGDFTVGDWVLADDADHAQVLLERQTLLHRRAAGSDARVQLIAANVDVLFITTSCNADFNAARLERYLALAYESGCFPVIVMTKADLADDPAGYAAQAQSLGATVPVLAVNAFDPDDLAQVAGWCKAGQTSALLGSSGVGKTTLTNGLCARTDDTGGIREDDAKGRHVTTSRALRRMTNGGWIIDTPGMRALRLQDVAEGIDTLFSDLAELAQGCRFSDCAHDSEPGCAIQAAIAVGEVDPARLTRWDKLKREEARNSETIAEGRARTRAFGKMVHSFQKEAKGRKGR